MNDALHAHYLTTDYRVRLPQGGCASIRIGARLPKPLSDRLRDDGEPWAFVTACNPRSRPQSRAANRRAQRQLLTALRASTPATMHIHAAIGVGRNGWREPSLFVLGFDFAVIDQLMQRFQQNAIVCGQGHGIAQLHVMPLA